MKTELLKPHPLNVRIYGQTESGELAESVKRLGILEPVVYSRMSVNGGDAHYYILSGTRRWLAAKVLKLDDVPTREVHLEGLEAERFLIESNRQREKSKGQRIREYKKLKEIEAALAKERERQAGKKKGMANLPYLGPARDKAAEQVGLKPRTAEKGLAVLKRAEAGDAKAQVAMAALDRGESSVHRAYTEIIAPSASGAENDGEAIALAALDEADELLAKAARAVSCYLAHRGTIEDRKDEEKTLRRLRERVRTLLVQLVDNNEKTH